MFADMEDWPLSTSSRDVERCKRISKNLARARVLFLEEVGNLGSLMLAFINSRCQQSRNDDRPFGGLIVFAFGCFFQAPPIGQPPIYFDPKDPRFNVDSFFLQNFFMVLFWHSTIIITWLNTFANVCRA